MGSNKKSSMRACKSYCMNIDSFKIMDSRNARNRNKEGTVDKHIHRCGNKSLTVRVDEAMCYFNFSKA